MIMQMVELSTMHESDAPYTCAVLARPDLYLECADIAAPSTLNGYLIGSHTFGDFIGLRDRESSLKLFGQNEGCGIPDRVVGDGLISYLDAAALMNAHTMSYPYGSAPELHRTVHPDGRNVGLRCGNPLTFTEHYSLLYGRAHQGGTPGQCYDCVEHEVCLPTRHISAQEVRETIPPIVRHLSTDSPLPSVQAAEWVSPIGSVTKAGYTLDDLPIDVSEWLKCDAGTWYVIAPDLFFGAIELHLVGVKPAAFEGVLLSNRPAPSSCSNDTTSPSVRFSFPADASCHVQPSLPPFAVRWGVLSLRTIVNRTALTMCKVKVFVFVPDHARGVGRCDFGVSEGSVATNYERGAMVRDLVCATVDQTPPPVSAPPRSPSPSPPAILVRMSDWYFLILCMLLMLVCYMMCFSTLRVHVRLVMR